MIGVLGASGRIGGVVTRTLLDRGVPVRVISRDSRRVARWGAAGAEVAVADLGRPSDLERALTGLASCFVLLPEDPRTDDFHGGRARLIDSLSGAVAAARVPHVVALSALPAWSSEAEGPPKGLFAFERALRAATPVLTAIRPCPFQENLLAALPAATGHGVFPCFLPSPEVAAPMVATADVGQLAAEILLSPPRAEAIDVLGPVYTVRRTAELLGEALGRPLDVVVVPPEAQARSLVDAGLSPSFAEAVAALYAYLASGRVRPGGDRMVHATTRIEDALPGWLAAA